MFGSKQEKVATMWILSNQILRSSAAMSRMPSPEGSGRLLRLSVMVLLISLLLSVVAGCGFLQTTADVANTLQRAFAGRNAQVKIESNADTITVIRTYPGTVVNLYANVDSTYRLNSGDLMTVRWAGQNRAILVAEIVPDTVKVVKP